jgi:ribosomal RNA-processing protein 12
MIRLFGYDHIIQYTTDLEDGRKILSNIKKRRERAKRKKAASAGWSDEEVRSACTHIHNQTYPDIQQEPAERAGEDAFEDVIYGSESEVDSEEEQTKGNAQPRPPLKGASKKSNGPAHLRADGDDPMDLLEGIGAHGLICECSYSLNDLVIGSNWTGPSSSSQEAPQTRARSDQVQDGRRDRSDDYR